MNSLRRAAVFSPCLLWTVPVCANCEVGDGCFTWKHLAIAAAAGFGLGVLVLVVLLLVVWRRNWTLPCHRSADRRHSDTQLPRPSNTPLQRARHPQNEASGPSGEITPRTVLGRVLTRQEVIALQSREGQNIASDDYDDVYLVAVPASDGSQRYELHHSSRDTAASRTVNDADDGRPVYDDLYLIAVPSTDGRQVEDSQDSANSVTASCIDESPYMSLGTRVVYEIRPYSALNTPASRTNRQNILGI